MSTWFGHTAFADAQTLHGLALSDRLDGTLLLGLLLI